MTATAATPRIVVLDSFAIDQGEPETTWRELAQLGELVVHPQTEPAEVGAHARDAVAVLTNKVALSAADLQALPQVRYVGVTATGTNVVDLAAARAAGIAVTNVPGYATDSVAELVFGLILKFAFDVAGHNAVREGGGLGVLVGLLLLPAAAHGAGRQDVGPGRRGRDRRRRRAHRRSVRHARDPRGRAGRAAAPRADAHAAGRGAAGG